MKKTIENRTVIGCLSWLAKQTRPDIQFQVCQAQRKQRNPTHANVKETNKIVTDALKFTDNGIALHGMAEEDICILAYDDAAWGNTSPDGDDDHEARNGNHEAASQLGSLILIAENKCLTPEGGQFSAVDWKSKAAQRVCRSTFAGPWRAATPTATGIRFPDHLAGEKIPMSQTVEVCTIISIVKEFLSSHREEACH